MGYIFEFKVADGRYSQKSRREHEKEKIKQHNPILNKREGGGGRMAKKKTK